VFAVPESTGNMKPKLLYDVIRQTSPRKLLNAHINRYSLLPRDASPADSVRSTNSIRSRSVSIKRKNSNSDNTDSLSYAVAAAGSGPGSGSDSVSPTVNSVQEQEILTENIVKVKSICDKVGSELSNSQVDPSLVSVFSLINEAIVGLCDNQLKIVEKKFSTTGNTSVPEPQSWSTAVSQKRLRQDKDQIQYVDLATLKSSQQVSTKSRIAIEPDPAVKKFKDTIKDAEKSTLIFGLNLGKVPLINQDAMSTKVTKAITEKAAQKDGSKGSVPKEDTITALDDVLSIVENVRFYGKTTKSYQNPRDPLNGSYCTIPVRYDFSDKESRIYAESVLRDKCKIQCSTPYPTILREAIKQVQESVKSQYKDHFVKVNVDTSSMTLRVSKRPMLAEGETGKKHWSYVGNPIPIPNECLDIHARKVPDGFKVVIPNAAMEIDNLSGSGSGGGSGATTTPHQSPHKNSPPRRSSVNNSEILPARS
jgi:hypothetical protein